jgi:hypothetical protein
VSRISLSERSVERLIHSGQDWLLETSAWQKVDRDIFAKAPSLTEGREAILLTLRDMGAEASLVHQITKLLDRPPEVPTSYVLRGGQFHPEPLDAPPVPSARGREKTPSYGMRIEDLRHELETLRARVRELETFLAGVDADHASTSNENALHDEEPSLNAI